MSASTTSYFSPRVFASAGAAEEQRTNMLFPAAYQVVAHGDGFVIVPKERPVAA